MDKSELQQVQAALASEKEAYQKENQRVKDVLEEMVSVRNQLHDDYEGILDNTLALLTDEEDAELRKLAIQKYEQADSELMEGYRSAFSKTMDEWEDFKVTSRRKQAKLEDQIMTLKRKEK
ncbi:hypothetical protein [Limosilactobacillus equigenerosi]|uniref:Uncharacterized protein n=2 Tax=Limosilactobacillus TaxID=2742598 RepID=A0A0R1ULI2_9LACO|nr:hypothetical protein [Limosilactobacillus equigenerosi]KRL92195.1 hypothetical protein FC21_GL000430 [Limosilactobacillus equigenerosi DSM 18793 = JCM 14505]